MELAFYVAAAIAVISTAMTITRMNAVHALLYLALSLIAVAVVFFIMGAELVAALEVIIYAGAIIVFFVFVVMMLNLGPAAVEREKELFSPGAWIGPSILAAILIAEFLWVLVRQPPRPPSGGMVTAKQVGIALWGPYVIGAELASILLTGALIAAYHLGWKPESEPEDSNARSSDRTRSAAGGDLVRAGGGGAARTAQRDLRPDVH